MNAGKLREVVLSLDLPDGGYALFGGTIMAALGIRDAGDIDLFVTDDVFQQLEAAGWERRSEHNRSHYLVNSLDGIAAQAFRVWEGEGWVPDIRGYINNPEVVDGLPFMPLARLYEWKAATRRPKDVEDLALIEAYWADR